MLNYFFVRFVFPIPSSLNFNAFAIKKPYKLRKRTGFRNEAVLFQAGSLHGHCSSFMGVFWDARH